MSKFKTKLTCFILNVGRLTERDEMGRFNSIELQTRKTHAQTSYGWDGCLLACLLAGLHALYEFDPNWPLGTRELRYKQVAVLIPIQEFVHRGSEITFYQWKLLERWVLNKLDTGRYFVLRTVRRIYICTSYMQSILFSPPSPPRLHDLISNCRMILQNFKLD